MTLRSDAPVRNVTEVGPGDYVKLDEGWLKIITNTAHNMLRTPRSWTIAVEGGREVGMYEIYRYARLEDFRAATRSC